MNRNDKHKDQSWHDHMAYAFIWHFFDNLLLAGFGLILALTSKQPGVEAAVKTAFSTYFVPTGVLAALAGIYLYNQQQDRRCK